MSLLLLKHSTFWDDPKLRIHFHFKFQKNLEEYMSCGFYLKISPQYLQHHPAPTH